MRSDHRGVWKKVTLVWCRTDICRKLSGRRRQGRAHRTRASFRSARSHGPSWSRPDQVTKLEVSSGFGLVTSFDVAARDGRFKRTSITSPKPGTPTVSALTRARAGRKPATRPACGEARRWRLRVQERHRAGRLPGSGARGAGPGDTVTSAANPQISNLQITIRRPPAPCRISRPPRANPARFHADFKLITIPVLRPPGGQHA